MDELHVEILVVNSTLGVDGGIAEPEAVLRVADPEDAGDHDRDGTLLELREVTDVGLLAVGLQDKPVADLQLQLVCGRLRERDLEERHLAVRARSGMFVVTARTRARVGRGSRPATTRSCDSTPAAGTRRFR